MASDGLKFDLINAVRANPDKGTGLFYAVNKEGIAALNRLTAADKGLIVPYLLIWQVNPENGKPAFPDKNDPTKPNRPLTMQMVSPPNFGSSLDGYLRERPVVSLEKVVVKNEASKGIITYQQVTLSIMVHRPDVFNLTPTPDKRDYDDWTALIVPGNVFGIEYGWSSAPIKNDLFNGVGITKNDVIIPGRKVIYVSITNYNFKIQPDLQIKIDIVGYETGLLNLKKFIIGSSPTSIDASKLQPEDIEFKFALPPRSANENLYATEAGKKIKNDFSGAVSKLPTKCTLKELLNSPLILNSIVKSFVESGYDQKKITLAYGNFNKRAGSISPKFAGVGKSLSMSGKPIGDFVIPISKIQEMVKKNFKAGLALTVTNFILPFVRLCNDPRNWTTENAAKKKDAKTPNQSIPEVFVKIVPNGNAIGMYIVDAKAEFAGLTPEDNTKHSLGKNATKDKIAAELDKLGIAIISFSNGNSYIKDASFAVEADPKIKAHFIQKYYESDKSKSKSQTDRKEKEKSMSAEETLYSAAVTGDITTLGNFAFDTFSLVWLEFGIRRWDGPFNVRNREDVITRGTFETKISFVATGTDPLDTQGRRQTKQVVVGVPPADKTTPDPNAPLGRDSVTGAPLVKPGAVNAAGLK